MIVPEGTKFIFFVIPVFLIAIVVVFFLFSNKSQVWDSNSGENIYGTDTEDDIDFEELKIETLEEGSGKEAETGDEISVNYVGTLKDGTQFDSSYDRGETFTFVLGIGQVIDGWDEGVAGMKVGEIRRLEIPSSLGYGEYGSGVIPGDAGLIFEVELVSIND
ncbi:MAG: FKBP-type peptidyl-prolyl cis-trans isomerase [Candidatus Dojkabacteria bacterium]|nr:FKBP-type peptidyl-prolyl cis-trans isomerase [Candidatus Dojkabacteria bacterium]